MNLKTILTEPTKPNRHVYVSLFLLPLRNNIPHQQHIIIDFVNDLIYMLECMHMSREERHTMAACPRGRSKGYYAGLATASLRRQRDRRDNVRPRPVFRSLLRPQDLSCEDTCTPPPSHFLTLESSVCPRRSRGCAALHSVLWKLALGNQLVAVCKSKSPH